MAKKWTDEELQRLLNDGQFDSAEPTKEELQLFEEIYQTLEEEETPVPMKFSKDVMRKVFLENERKRAIRSSVMWYGLVLAVLGMTLGVFYFFEISFSFLSFETLLMKVTPAIIIISAVFLLIQLADQLFVRTAREK